MAGLVDIPVDRLALGTKARRALEELRVRTVREFLELDVNRVLRLRSIGKGTRDQLLALQQWVATHSPWLQGAGDYSSTACPSDDLESVKKQLTARARRAVDHLGVSTVADLMSLRPEDVLEKPWMGVRTWAEIAGLQERLRYTLLTSSERSAGTGTWHDKAREERESTRAVPPMCPAERMAAAIDFSSFATMVHTFLGWIAGSVSGADLMMRSTSSSVTAAGDRGSCTIEDISESAQSADVRTVRRLAAGSRQLDLSPLNPLWTAVREILLGAGGVVDLPHLARGIVWRMGWEQSPVASDLAAIVTLHPDFRVDQRSGMAMSIACPCVTCAESLVRLGDIVRSHSGSVHVVDAGYDLAAQCRLHCRSDVSVPAAFDEAFVRFAAGRTSELVARDERVYMAAQGTPQNAESLRDAIRACLEAEGKAMHYTEIAERVRRTHPRYSRVSNSGVYQRLYLDRSFVRVRRGTYALTGAPITSHGQAWSAGTEPRVPDETPISLTYEAMEARHSDNVGIPQVHDMVEVGDRTPGAHRRRDRSAGTRHEYVARSAQDIVLMLDDGSEAGFGLSAAPPLDRVLRYDRDMPLDDLVACPTSRLKRRPRVTAVSGRSCGSEVEQLLRSATTRLHRSYKPVLVLSILDSIDETGHCPIRKVIRSFGQFYAQRMQSGLIPEAAGSSILSALGGSGNVDLDLVQLIVERHPLRILRRAGLLSVRGDQIVVNASLLAALRSSDCEEHMRTVLGVAVSEYFERLSVSMR